MSNSAAYASNIPWISFNDLELKGSKLVFPPKANLMSLESQKNLRVKSQGEVFSGSQFDFNNCGLKRKDITSRKRARDKLSQELLNCSKRMRYQLKDYQ